MPMWAFDNTINSKTENLFGAIYHWWTTRPGKELWTYEGRKWI